LYCCLEFRYPIEKGDKLRAYHQLRYLSKKHEIILCALSDEEIQPDAVVELEKIVSELHIIKHEIILCALSDAG